MKYDFKKKVSNSWRVGNYKDDDPKQGPSRVFSRKLAQTETGIHERIRQC
jgi:hypothetical protein